MAFHARYTGDIEIYPALGGELELLRNSTYASACYQAALLQMPDSVDAKNGLARVKCALRAAGR